MIYDVYSNSDLVHWSPAKIFQDEIKIVIGVLRLNYIDNPATEI